MYLSGDLRYRLNIQNIKYISENRKIITFIAEHPLWSVVLAADFLALDFAALGEVGVLGLPVSRFTLEHQVPIVYHLVVFATAPSRTFVDLQKLG